MNVKHILKARRCGPGPSSTPKPGSLTLFRDCRKKNSQRRAEIEEFSRFRDFIICSIVKVGPVSRGALRALLDPEPGANCPSYPPLATALGRGVITPHQDGI